MIKKLITLSIVLVSWKLWAQQPNEPSTEIAEAKTLVADFDSSRVIFPFSDLDELRKSTTSFAISKVDHTSIHDQALRIDYSIQSYGGIAIEIESMDVTQYAVLSFKARLPEGQLPKFHLQFKDEAGNRTKIYISSFLSNLNDQWARFEIPLDQMLIMNAHWMKRVNEVALIFAQGKGILELDDLWLEKRDGKGMQGIEFEVPAFEKSKIPLVAGHGAWSYGGAAFSYDAVKRYNPKSPNESKIRYVFPYSGTVEFGPGDKYDFLWNPDTAMALANLFQNSENLQDVHVMPMVDGLSHGANQLSLETWEALAREIGTNIENTPQFSGLHLDIEPNAPILFYLYTKLRTYTAKPITVAVGTLSKDVFAYADLVVYMAYDWADSPEGFAEDAQARIPAFIAAAKKAECKVLIGVPAIATHNEMEGYAMQQNSLRTETGHSMHEFVKASMDTITQACSEPNSTTCLGVSVWALHEQYGLHGKRDTKWYFPTMISEKTWELIRTPVVTSQTSEAK